MAYADCLEMIEKAAQEGAVELDLSGQDLQTLPPEIGRLTQLTWLNLGGNRLTEVPAAITQLTQLTSLNLHRNQLTQVPAAIAQLTQLDELYLSGNKLTALPPEITRLTQLTSLDLSENQLTALPAAITQLTQLTVLDLSGNQLTVVPAGISQLTQLTHLSLSQNRLAEVPPAITQLTQLTHLYFSNNRLTHVPAAFIQLTKLRQLALGGNEALDFPPEIFRNWEDAPTILRYIEQISSEEPKRPLNEAKVVLVGEGRVGKTSLVNMLLEGHADPHEPQTERIDIRRWPLAIGDETVQLNVWDFGGQEIMHATHQFFLTRRSLYLLVLNAREGETRGRFDYWLKIIGSFGGDSPVIVVTNWSDENRLQLNRRDLHDKYPGRIRAFVDTACMAPLKGETGNGIDDLKKHIATEISALDHLRNPLLTRWFEVKKQLEEMKENYIPESEYTAMCEGQGITDERDRALLLGYLNDLGVVLTFKDDQRLRDTNILNPEWVTQGIYKILNSNELFQSKGVLRTTALPHILDRGEYPRDKHEFLIGMMRKFELCFAFEGREDTYLIPDLLPKEQPALNWDEETALGWEYHYDVLPGSVISRFIVRTSHLLPKDQLAYWRSGVVLNIDGNKARVKADSDARKATVSILGREPGRHRALAVIRDHFAHIHETIPGIVVEEKVPVPNQTCKPVEYQHLLDMRREGIEKFLPPGGREQVSVAWLLEGIEERRVGRGEFGDRDPGPPLRPRPKPVVRPPVPDVPPAPAPGGTWGTRWFVLVVCLAIIGALVVAAQYVDWLELTAILIAAVLLVAVVLVVQLTFEGKVKGSAVGLVKAVLAKVGLLRPGANGSQKSDHSGP